MKNLLEITGAVAPSLDMLVQGLELVRENGDVVVVKLDGQRNANVCTVFITFAASKGREMIRVEGEELKPSLLKALRMYAQS